jgi:DNA (cytosine-5)-methyltransferase 1
VNYYNDNDPKAAAWLRELVKQNLIPPGDVDERSIEDVTGADLKGYTQCHFFAGIGGWLEALRLAGWPADRPVWTGSCPCQPFSSAGKRQGEKDKRHLWPEFFRLIKECKPPIVFGEQVTSAEVVGTELEAAFIVAVQSGNYARANKLAKRLVASKSFHYYQRWIDGVRTNLEAENYAVGFAILGAHSVNAPHIRQRLYWMADTESGRNRRNSGAETRQDTAYQGVGENASGIPGYINCGLSTSRMADTTGRQCQQRGRTQRHLLQRPTDNCTNGGVGDSESNAEWQCGQPKTGNESQIKTRGSGLSFWSNSIAIPCRDGKARRIEPAFFPLADGIPGRVAMLRGFGNAIVPQVAAEFIKAYEECDKR